MSNRLAAKKAPGYLSINTGKQQTTGHMDATTYPSTAPTLPKELTGKAHVQGSEPGQVFTVNFDTGECDCAHGAAWHWTGKRYEPKAFCNHKLRAVASLVKRTGSDSLYDFYEKEVGKRYNPFVITSAFHKELRRGSVTDALYWATALLPHRGASGVVAYMRNIVFEETRDIELYRFILKVSSKGRGVSVLEMQQAVRRFCIAPKKWELPWRLDVFLDEMRGYKKLAAEHGYEVARPKDIVPALFTPGLRNAMFEGFATADRALVQYGLKGLLKAQSKEHEAHKVDTFNWLTEVLNDEHPNTFEYDHDYAHALHDLIHKRMRAHGGLGYHECNALADALCGEPGTSPAAMPTKTAHKACTAFPRLYRMPLAEIRKVPLYANDNHTHEGKRRMAKYPAQLRPGADQTDIDFRLCGAYMGVAWRLLAVSQLGTIDCKWGDVSWSKPNWLWSHLNNMWY
jgi:hypothetical protein